MENGNTLPDWYRKDLHIPSAFNPANLPTRNTVITGTVGSFKSLFIKSSIPYALLQNGVLVLDVHNEYPGKAARPRLDPNLISVEFLQSILNSTAAYVLDVVECIRSRLPVKEFLEDSTLSKTQQMYFVHAMKKVELLLGDGTDVIDGINQFPYFRLVFNPDLATEQLFLTLRQLIYSSKKLTRGVVVIAEELEKLGDIDQKGIIEEFIMAGRKKGMYLVFVSHMSPEMLMEFLGSAYFQFDSHSHFFPDGHYETDQNEQIITGVL